MGFNDFGAMLRAKHRACNEASEALFEFCDVEEIRKVTEIVRKMKAPENKKHWSTANKITGNTAAKAQQSLTLCHGELAQVLSGNSETDITEEGF